MTDESDNTEAMSTKNGMDSEQPDPNVLQSMRRAMIGLGLFAVITAGLIAITQFNTAERIAEQIKLARSKALLEIIPLSEHNNDLLTDAIWLDSVTELGLTDSSEAFIAKQDGTPVTLILPLVAPEGYSGPIRLVAGINISGEIRGVRVIEHKETPGLGDKISLKKSDWILGFDGRSLANTSETGWRVRKDGGEFDQLTGATITPRAIVKAVHSALLYYQDHKEALLDSFQQGQKPVNTPLQEQQ